MTLIYLSNWLEQVTRPNHLLYHPVQISLFASVSYTTTLCLTSVPPIYGMSFAVLAYAISQLVTPFFVQCFEPYQGIALVPLIGQVLQISFSLISAKMICQLMGQTLSFKEVQQVSLIFLTSLFISRLVLFKLRLLLNEQVRV